MDPADSPGDYPAGVVDGLFFSFFQLFAFTMPELNQSLSMNILVFL